MENFTKEEKKLIFTALAFLISVDFSLEIDDKMVKNVRKLMKKLSAGEKQSTYLQVWIDSVKDDPILFEELSKIIKYKKV